MFEAMSSSILHIDSIGLEGCLRYQNDEILPFDSQIHCFPDHEMTAFRPPWGDGLLDPTYSTVSNVFTAFECSEVQNCLTKKIKNTFPGWSVSPTNVGSMRAGFWTVHNGFHPIGTPLRTLKTSFLHNNVRPAVSKGNTLSPCSSITCQDEKNQPNFGFDNGLWFFTDFIKNCRPYTLHQAVIWSKQELHHSVDPIRFCLMNLTDEENSTSQFKRSSSTFVVRISPWPTNLKKSHSTLPPTVWWKAFEVFQVHPRTNVKRGMHANHEEHGPEREFLFQNVGWKKEPSASWFLQHKVLRPNLNSDHLRWFIDQKTKDVKNGKGWFLNLFLQSDFVWEVCRIYIQMARNDDYNFLIWWIRGVENQLVFMI